MRGGRACGGRTCGGAPPRRAGLIAVLGTAALLRPVAALAQGQASVTQPPLDLGQTSFLDGEAGRGALVEVISNGTTAQQFTDRNGRPLTGTHTQRVGTVIVHPAYVSGQQALGGHLGVEVLVPVSLVRLDVPGTPVTTQGGLGDVTIAPFVQWSDGHVFGRPFSARFAVQAVAPLGTYAPPRQISTGQNAWQVSPYLAYTWRATDRAELSGRLIYDWSGRNDRPPAALNARSSSQAADQFATNLSASYAASAQWRVGVAGYAFRTLGTPRVDGRDVAGSRQRAFAVGPGVRWRLGRASVIGTVYREFATENRPEGFNAVLRLLQPF